MKLRDLINNFPETAEILVRIDGYDVEIVQFEDEENGKFIILKLEADENDNCSHWETPGWPPIEGCDPDTGEGLPPPEMI